MWLLNNPLPIPYGNPVIPIFPRQPTGSSTNPQVNHWLQRDSLKERCHLYSYACWGGVMTEATWLHVFLIPLSLNSFPGNLFQVFNPILSSGSSHDHIFMPVYYALGPLPRPWECLLSCLPFISNSTLHLSSHWFIHSQSSYNHVSKIVLIQSPFLIFGTPNGYFLVFNFLDTADHSLYIDPPLLSFYAINLLSGYFPAPLPNAPSLFCVPVSHTLLALEALGLCPLIIPYTLLEKISSISWLHFPPTCWTCPHLYLPLNCLPWVLDPYFQQSGGQVCLGCPRDT